MAKKTESERLYEQIIKYTPTESEQAREQERIQKLSDLYTEQNQLKEEGNDLIRGVPRGDVILGHFRDADKAVQIKERLTRIGYEIRALKGVENPIVDDEYIKIVDDLASVVEQKESLEKQYNDAVREYENSKGKVPFDMYRNIEEECYSLSAELQSVKAKEKELQFAKNNYVRKTDVLFSKYEKVKQIEIKQHLKTVLTEVVDYLNAQHNEMLTAKDVTMARKGVKDVSHLLMIPFRGDWVLEIIEKLRAVLQIVERR